MLGNSRALVDPCGRLERAYPGHQSAVHAWAVRPALPGAGLRSQSSTLGRTCRGPAAGRPAKSALTSHPPIASRPTSSSELPFGTIDHGVADINLSPTVQAFPTAAIESLPDRECAIASPCTSAKGGGKQITTCYGCCETILNASPWGRNETAAQSFVRNALKLARRNKIWARSG